MAAWKQFVKMFRSKASSSSSSSSENCNEKYINKESNSDYNNDNGNATISEDCTRSSRHDFYSILETWSKMQREKSELQCAIEETRIQCGKLEVLMNTKRDSINFRNICYDSLEMDLENQHCRGLKLKFQLTDLLIKLSILTENMDEAKRLLDSQWQYTFEFCDICYDYADPYAEVTWVRYLPCKHLICPRCFINTYVCLTQQLREENLPHRDLNSYGKLYRLKCHMCRSYANNINYIKNNKSIILSIETINNVNQIFKFFNMY